MASIRKLPNGNFQATISAGRDKNNVQIRYYITCEKEKDCKALAREKEQELYEKRVGIDPNTRATSMFDKWMELNRSRLSPTTLRGYEGYVKRFKEYFGSTKIGRISHVHIEDFLRMIREGSLEYRKTTSTTQRKYFFVLSEIFTWALKHKSPCTDVKPPKKSDYEYTILTPEQFELLLYHVAGKKDEMKILLAGRCGMRLAEIYGLTWDNIDVKNKIIKIRKTIVKSGPGAFIEKLPKSKSGIRDIIISDELAGRLELYKKETAVIGGYVFFRDGDNPEAFSKRFSHIISLTELPKIRFHDLRHYRATQLLAAGVPDIVSQLQLGHADIAMTKKYQHSRDDLLKDAAEKINSLK